MDKVVITKKLCKKIGQNNIIKNIDMNINKGEIYALIGKNGAGKTTLMKLLVSLISPTSGEVKILEGSANNNFTQNKKLGVMIENPAFYPYLSAKQNLEYYKRVKGLPKSEDITELLKLVGLEDAGKKKFKDFSLGMKQRLGLALALLGRPELLILDEPINGLDPEGIRDVRNILIEQNKKYGTTIIISSHILSELSYFATKFGFIDNGKLIEEISYDDLQNKCNGYLMLKVDNSVNTVKVLDEKLNLKNYEIIDENNIKILDTKYNSSKLNQMLLKNNIEVFELLKSKENLEEYFLNLINKKGKKRCQCH